jgi:hypothetical protein
LVSGLQSETNFLEEKVKDRSDSSANIYFICPSPGIIFASKVGHRFLIGICIESQGEVENEVSG